MALAKCKECGKSVSTRAKSCPACGVPNPVKKIKPKTEQPSGNYFEDFNDGKLELAPAFWIFGVIVGSIGGFILGYLSFSNKILLLPYIGFNGWILSCLWVIAEKHIKEKKEYGESTFWGQATYVYIVLSVIGVIYNVYDTIVNI